MKRFLMPLMGMMVLLLPFLSQAQYALTPISLDQRINNSDLIIEAEVMESVSFINNLDQHIYTANHLKVYKIFKGFASTAQVTLISPGGIVGDIGESVCPSIDLNTGTIGTFFLYQSDMTSEVFTKAYQPFSGPQGCIYYDLESNIGSDVFNEYNSLENIYQKIELTTNQNFIAVTPLNLPTQKSNKAVKPVISSISPISVAAGIGDEIEIRGENFGNSKGIGKVSFLNASTGNPFVEPVSSQYLLWSDTLIRIIIPSQAGSGSVRVEQDGLALFIGFEIRFSQLNFGSSNPNPTLMIDDNNAGGFTWKMSNGFFANTDAKNSLERAMNSWSDKTCINWENGASTVVDRDFRDGTNNVRFGITGELPTGVLAHTRNYYQDCGASTAYTTEIDLTFDPDRNWNYDEGNPGSSQYDIETVAVHELGHAHQLGHVKDKNDFMAATVTPGITKRVLGTNNIEAGLYVMKYSASPKECGPESMDPKAGCTLPIGVEDIISENNFEIFPNPFNHVLNFEFKSTDFISLYIMDVQGRIIYENFEIENQSSLSWIVPQNIPNGMYIVRLQNGSEWSHDKVMLNR